VESPRLSGSYSLSSAAFAPVRGLARKRSAAVRSSRLISPACRKFACPPASPSVSQHRWRRCEQREFCISASTARVPVRRPSLNAAARSASRRHCCTSLRSSGRVAIMRLCFEESGSLAVKPVAETGGSARSWELVHTRPSERTSAGCGLSLPPLLRCDRSAAASRAGRARPTPRLADAAHSARMARAAHWLREATRSEARQRSCGRGWLPGRCARAALTEIRGAARRRLRYGFVCEHQPSCSRRPRATIAAVRIVAPKLAPIVASHAGATRRTMGLCRPPAICAEAPRRRSRVSLLGRRRRARRAGPTAPRVFGRRYESPCPKWSRWRRRR